MTTKHDAHQVNAIQNHCIREFGGRIVRLGTFVKTSVALEGVICGLILVVAQLYETDALVFTDAVLDGVRKRIQEVAKVEEPNGARQ